MRRSVLQIIIMAMLVITPALPAFAHSGSGAHSHDDGGASERSLRKEYERKQKEIVAAQRKTYKAPATPAPSTASKTEPAAPRNLIYNKPKTNAAPKPLWQ